MSNEHARALRDAIRVYLNESPLRWELYETRAGCERWTREDDDHPRPWVVIPLNPKADDFGEVAAGALTAIIEADRSADIVNKIMAHALSAHTFGEILAALNERTRELERVVAVAKAAYVAEDRYQSAMQALEDALKGTP